MNKLVLKVRMENDEESLVVKELQNDFLNSEFVPVQYEYTREGVGKVKVTADKDVFNNGMPPKWYIQSTTNDKYVVSQVSTKECYIDAYDSNGNESDNVLQGVLVEIEVYASPLV